MRAAPRFTPADRLRALRESQRRYAARGVTAVYEGHGIAPEVLARLPREPRAGRADAALLAGREPDLGGGRGGARHPGAGGLGRRARARRRPAARRAASACTTAATPRSRASCTPRQPYTGWAGFVESANDPAAYRAQAELAARHGLRVNTLVTRCLPEVLDVWEDVARRHPIRDLRWVLVHLNAATPEQLARIRRARRGGHHQPDLLSLSLGRRRGGAGSAGPPTSCCPTGAWLASASRSASPPTTSRPIRGSPSPPSWPGATCARAQVRRASASGSRGRQALRRADGGRRLGDVRRARARPAGARLGGRPRGARARPAHRAARGSGRPDGTAHHGRGRDRAPMFDLRSPRVWLGIAWSVFQLYTAYAGMFDLLIQLPVHVAFAVALGFLTEPTAESAEQAEKARRRRPRRVAERRAWRCWPCCAPPTTSGTTRAWPRAWPWSTIPSALDVVVGVLFTLLLLEAARRHTGPALVSWRCRSSPTPSSGPGCRASCPTAARRSSSSSTSSCSRPRASSASPRIVSATFIYLFIVFGNVMDYGGLLRFFTDGCPGGGGRQPGRGRQGGRHLERALRHRQRQRDRQRGDDRAPSRSRS